MSKHQTHLLIGALLLLGGVLTVLSFTAAPHRRTTVTAETGGAHSRSTARASWSSSTPGLASHPALLDLRRGAPGAAG